jgi:LmbE family N-acetylglucosaminyl deacetylase
MKSEALVVAAHPDDETLFFTSVFTVLYPGAADLCCVTDGNYEGRGQARMAQLHSAGQALGVPRIELLSLKDSFRERLPVEEVYEAVLNLIRSGGYKVVYTHSPHGEYGHIQHQDVSYAVHWAAAELGVPVFSPGAFSRNYTAHTLSSDQFSLKLDILSGIYRTELAGFWYQLPIGPVEVFQELDFVEVEEVYKYFRAGIPPENLNRYREVARFMSP